MSIHFLFPSHPLRASQVEPTFADQADALRAAGFGTSVFPDGVIQDRKSIRNVPAAGTVIYRGWMFNEWQYRALDAAVTAAGAKLFTSTGQYLTAHHLPNWYPFVAEFTPETKIVSKSADLVAEFRALGWVFVFVKDYVKSLKTKRGSIIRDPGELSEVVAELEHFRGEIEGGICLRRVESILAETEQRYFVLCGRPFSPDGSAVPPIVSEVAGLIPSPFFSVDVARRSDGQLRLIEVGDGQVSDLVGWPVDRFVSIFSSLGGVVS